MSIQNPNVYADLQKADYNMKAGLALGSLAIISLFAARVLTGHFDVMTTLFVSATGGSLILGSAFSYKTRQSLLKKHNFKTMPEEAKCRWKELPMTMYTTFNENMNKSLDMAKRTITSWTR